MKKVRKRIRVKWKNLISLLIAYVAVVLIIICTIRIVKWKLDSNSTKDQTNALDTPSVLDTTGEEIIDQGDIDEANPYWDYIKMSLIDVDIAELKKTNSDVVGWIQLHGTNINYPFVQTTDNEYYLTHSLNKTKNSAGWVFLDYRNDIENDRNIILYAHSRVDSTMFGTLKNILSSTWTKNTNNYVINLVTEEESRLYQIFSIYHIPTTSDYLQIDFISDNEYRRLLDILIGRSQFDFNTSVNENDHILTLSTCYNNDKERVVLHAKLIKKKKK